MIFYFFHLKRLHIFLFFLFICVSIVKFHGQNFKNLSFETLREKYEVYNKNDKNALPFVNEIILKAKKEKNYYQLVEGYKDAIYYEPDKFLKLKYADSSLIAAFRSKNSDLIASSYLGKGIIYYSNFRKYTPALNEYLKALKYVKKSKNEYLHYKVIYHFGVVKSYLGYYQEAIFHFNHCIRYFESKLNTKLTPNEVYNHKKGYLNSIHQVLVCYRNLKNYKKSDSLIELGLKNSSDRADFVVEYNYFLNSKGISQYFKHQYTSALQHLFVSNKELRLNDDFSWVSVNYFYQGKSLMAIDKTSLAIRKFEKVDSIFNKNQFILPELRNNFEILIIYYKKRKNPEKQLYYMNQLLKSDSIINKDFIFLSTKVHKEYDKNILYEEKKELEKRIIERNIILFFFFSLSIGLLFLLILKYKKTNDIKLQYKILQQRILEKQNPVTKDNDIIKHKVHIESNSYEKQKNNLLSEEIIFEILNKLHFFEKNKEFLEKGITLNSLSSNFGTNTAYLSCVINEYKKMNFNRYINELRIYYITDQMYINPKFHHLTIEALAEECGYASRQHFSNLFYEINGIRPKDFLRNRINELKNN